MAYLSVNVNKIATLRNSRGENNPDLLSAAKEIISFGAHGITVHPRPDRRHIRFEDVELLKKSILVELNVEGYPSYDYIELVNKVKPAQITLVPDAPDALTSNAGWDVKKNKEFLEKKINELNKSGSRISIFVDPHTTNHEDLLIAKEIGVSRVELYTKVYADMFAVGKGNQAIASYKNTAEIAYKCGLGVNAGHDLNLHNLNFFLKEIPLVEEVSIGHALICDALWFGMRETISRYLEQLKA